MGVVVLAVLVFEQTVFHKDSTTDRIDMSIRVHMFTINVQVANEQHEKRIG